MVELKSIEKYSYSSPSSVLTNPLSWPTALKKAQFVYNNCDWEQTPFELWYGQAPKAIPIAFKYQDYPKTKEHLTLLQQWRWDTQTAHKYAQQQMKDRIKLSFRPFQLGQKVLYG